MKHRLTAIAMVGALLGTFVFAPISATVAKPTSKPFVAQRPTTKALQNLPVNGTLTDKGVPAGSFTGNVSITKMGYNQQTKQLLVDGVLNGTATPTNGTTTTLSNVPFHNAPATLKKGASAKQVGTCDILFLDIGPIYLDVLGLTVDLSEITLDINAVSGPGNLLGNLLCSLVGLLDQGGPLDGIINLLNQINAILSSL